MQVKLGAATPAVLDAGTIRALLAVAILIGTLAALWPSTQSLMAKWQDELVRAYSHGSLVVGVSCFLLWRLRRAPEPTRASALGFAACLGSTVLWMIAFRSGIQVAHQALVPLVVWSAIWAAFGGSFARRAIIPAGYLYFAIPVWDVFNHSLQWLSALAVRAELSLIGIPVHFDGLFFQIPAGQFEIAGGCSGLNYFNCAIALAVFYGELHDDRWSTRIKLVSLAILFGLLTNWVRIAIIILVGHLTQMDHYLVREEHYSFGWILFAIAMAGFLLIVRRWPGGAVAAGPAFTGATGNSARGLYLAAIALLTVGAWRLLDANVAAAPPDELVSTRPDSGWRFAAVPAPAAAPVFVGADQSGLRSLLSDGAIIDVFHAIYLRQSQGNELAGFENQPLGAEFRAASGRGATMVNNRPWSTVEAVDASGQRWLTWTSYRVGNRDFASLLRAQLYYGSASLWSDPLSSVIVLRTRCDSGCAASARTLRSVAENLRFWT